MTALPIPLRSNPGAYKIDGQPKVFNAYAVLGGQDRKSTSSLVPCTGLKAFGEDTEGACRGMIYIEEEATLFTVNGLRIFKFDSAGTKTELGLLTGEEPIIWARNDAENVETLIVADGLAYTITDATLGYAPNILPDGRVPAGVTLVGGYFLLWTDDARMYTSDLNSFTTQFLNFATAESDPDGLTACIGVQNTLYAIGTKSTEVWAIDGSTGFPLAPVQGASLRFGSLSKHTVKEIDNTILFVGSDNAVHQGIGYETKVISTDEIADLIEDEADKNALVAFVHTRGDNKFYTLQGTGWTREYNTKTGFWHDRFDDTENQWRAMHHAKAWNRDILGDRITGDLYEGDYDLFTSVGQPIVWGFDTSIIHAFPMGLSFSGIDLDMEVGHSELGEEAFLMLKWSDDGGRTWAERQLSLGQQGQYNKRVRSKRLGSCDENGRVFSVRISDPVIRAVSEIDIQANPVGL